MSDHGVGPRPGSETGPTLVIDNVGLLVTNYLSDVGRLTPGSAGHAVILDAPTYHHLAYRPGVPLIRETIGPLAGPRLAS